MHSFIHSFFCLLSSSPSPRGGVPEREFWCPFGWVSLATRAAFSLAFVLARIGCFPRVSLLAVTNVFQVVGVNPLQGFSV